MKGMEDSGQGTAGKQQTDTSIPGSEYKQKGRWRKRK